MKKHIDQQCLLYYIFIEFKQYFDIESGSKVSRVFNRFQHIEINNIAIALYDSIISFILLQNQIVLCFPTIIFVTVLPINISIIQYIDRANNVSHIRK